MNEGEHGHHEESSGYKKPGDFLKNVKDMFPGGGDHGDHGDHGGHDERGGSRSGSSWTQEKRYQYPPNFFTNAPKGTTREIAYKFMAQEIPELEMSVDEDTYMSNGQAMDDHVGVNMKRTPDNMLFVEKMWKDPIFKYIDSPIGLEVGEFLEERGSLQPGMSLRIMKRYQDKMFKKGLANPLFTQDLSDVMPASDEEIEAIVTLAIRQNYEDFKKHVQKPVW